MVEVNDELEKAKANLDKAVREFTAIRARENGVEDIYVMAWAVSSEYESRTLIDEDMTGHTVAVPSDQLTSTSRGLFEYGKDVFTRR